MFGRGGGFAAGGGDAAGAGRAGGTVGIDDFGGTGLLAGAGRGAAVGLVADGVGFLTPVDPGVAPEEGDCVADEVECDAVDDDCAAGGAAAEDAGVPVAAVGAGRAVVAGRTLEVVGALVRRAPGAAGARATDCAELVAAIPDLAARSAAALAASPIRDPESEVPLSVGAAAREAEAVADAVEGLAAGGLGGVPPTPGIPNPAGDAGFPAAGVGPAVAADVEAGADVEARVFAGGAAGAAVAGCDGAPEDVGADAPLPAESVSTGPSGSNN